MRKVEKSKNEKILEIIRKFPEEFKKTPPGDLYCKLCNSIISHHSKSIIDAYRASKAHKKNLNMGVNDKDQTFLDNNLEKFSLATDVTSAFLQADIPLYKLRNKAIKELFNKLDHPIPSEMTFRNSIDKLYEKRIGDLKTYFINKKVFIVAYESFLNG